MRSTTRPMSDVRWLAFTTAVILLLAAGGCAYVPNYFKEDGPSTTAQWDSPTAADIRARFAAAEPRARGWEARSVTAESGVVAHWPLYFEDPFEDKGHGRTDETHPHDVYRGGWEDYVAAPYGAARFTANWLLLPVSAIVTPYWTVMESDGVISKQLVWYDHDAARTSHHMFEPAPKPAPEPVADEPPASEPAPQ